jgi:Fe-S cluster assembly protein SufD
MNTGTATGAPTGTAIDLQSKLVLEFQHFEAGLNGQRASRVHAVRRQAMEQFSALGFPTVRHEEWKYTNVMPVVKHDYTIFVPKPALTKDDVQPMLIEGMNANVLVVINGAYAPELSTIVSQQDGVLVTSFAEALTKHTALVEQHFAKYAGSDGNAFVALNTAFARDGVLISLDKGVVVEEPFHILYINDARTTNVLVQPRNLLLLGDRAELTVVESSHLLGKGQGLTNAVTEAVVGDHAVLHLYTIQNDTEHSSYIGTTQVHQEASSVFNSVVVSLGGSFIRNNLNTVLNNKGTDTHYYGLFVVGGKTVVDNHTLVDHAMPHCTSNELYKGILDGQATGVFNGKIMVRQDAQKTLAYQSNRNILLSQSATMNNKPQLEIFADDVKCSHGAATGQLDEEPLFYLQARGISKDRAKALLLYAFAGEITEKIKITPLRNALNRLIADRLHQELDTVEVEF